MCDASKNDDNLPLLAGDARARSQVYGLLARVFRAEPDEILIRHLRSPEVRLALGVLGESVSRFLEQNEMEENLATLSEEFARLFLGPGPHISLHESVLIPGGGLLRGKETVAVKAFMKAAGFVVPEGAILPDHLSVELEFMAHLCEEEARSRLEGDPSRVRNATDWQAAFLTRHLGKWIGTVKDRLSVAMPSPLYALFIELLCVFIEHDSQ